MKSWIFMSAQELPSTFIKFRGYFMKLGKYFP